MTDLVVGVDTGATSTRALAAGVDGRFVGRGASGGGNPNSHPPEVAAGRVAEAIHSALAGADPASVTACLLGVAGRSKFTDPAVLEVFHAALHRIGLTCPITIRSDAEVAFASATDSPDGTALIGGTGSVAVRIVNHRETLQYGGWGWLLGDEGSAFWLGREAIRATLRQLVSGEPLGTLAAAVLTEALGDPSAADRHQAMQLLITSANAEPPIRLARYGTMVSAQVAADPVAADIVRRAAELLAEHAFAARTPGERTPIVLTGSVIGPTSPVGIALRADLAGKAEVLSAADGVAGAAWLAALEVAGPTAPRPQIP
jgi:N-acetylglucosamine kinase-like BadF-type ATPase